MRIRSIKPEFFEHEGLGALSHAHRLTFIGLWLLADREGRLKDQPRRIALKLFPWELDRIDMGAIIGDLAGHKDRFIIRYQVDGEAFIQIRGFIEHQRPHHKEPPSLLPPMPDNVNPDKSASSGTMLQTSLPDPSVNDGATAPQASSDHAASTAMNGASIPGEPRADPLGREGKGKEGKDGRSKHDRTAERLLTGGGKATAQDLRAAWNTHATRLPRCIALSKKRIEHARARLADYPLDYWIETFRGLNRLDFCKGSNDRTWKATFDWIIANDENHLKAREGKYGTFNGAPVQEPRRPLSAATAPRRGVPPPAEAKALLDKIARRPDEETAVRGQA